MEATPISAQSTVTLARAELQEVLRLKELFATLPGPLVAGRVLPSLPEVLLIAPCAMICDCEDFTDMGHFAQPRLPRLRQFIPPRNGAPSHDVFRNVFLFLKPDGLLEIMELWVGNLTGKQVTIDGKARRGAKDTHTGKSMPHILRAWVSEASLRGGHEVARRKAISWKLCGDSLPNSSSTEPSSPWMPWAATPASPASSRTPGPATSSRTKAPKEEAHQAVVAHNLTLMREPSNKVLKSSGGKVCIRSKRRRCCLNPAFKTEATQHIPHDFGA